MRDWHEFVRKQLALTDFAPEREEKIVTELAAQMEEFYANGLSRGMSQQEADEFARRQVKDWECFASEVRRADPPGAAARLDRWVDHTRESIPKKREGIMLLASLFKDITYAARMLRRSPGFTAVAILTLALGIGANTAIFTLAKAALLQPLPYDDPDRLVQIWESSPQPGWGEIETSGPSFLDWKEQNSVFSGLAGYVLGSFNLTEVGEAERLPGLRVTTEFFQILGVQPRLGRAFQPAEGETGGEYRVILSHSLWQRRFGSDPKLLGQNITLNSVRYEVIGILPRSFFFAQAGTRDVWVPITRNTLMTAPRVGHFVEVVARLQSDVSLQQADAEMNTIARLIEDQHPDTNSDISVSLVPLHEEVVGKVRPIFLILLGGVGFVLMIACANVSNLLLSRAAARDKEFAIRRALGASRSRLIRQLLAESLVLGLAGGAMGISWAWWGVDLLVATVPASRLARMPYLQDLHMDSAILGFTFLISILTGILFGVIPAFQASRLNPNECLKEGGRNQPSGRNRVQNLLIVSEVALALVLLIGASLMVRSFVALLEHDPGFDPDNVLTLRTALPGTEYAPAERTVFYREFLERVRALPGVKGAATITTLPLLRWNTGYYAVEGEPPVPSGQEPTFFSRTISKDYLATMQVPLLQGRDFDTLDDIEFQLNDQGVPIPVTQVRIIISQSLVDRHFSNQSPVGNHLIFPGPVEVIGEIIGVSGDVQHGDQPAGTLPTIYFYQGQVPLTATNTVIRTTTDPLRLAATVRGTVQTLDPDLPAYNLKTMNQVAAETPAYFIRRFPSTLITAFALSALLLAIVGIYGVISHIVGRRIHEMGIRMALGARASDVRKLVLAQGMTPVLGGIGLGLVVAFALTRFLSTFLYGVSPTDVLTFTAIPLVLIFVALLACYIPARRASKVDPMVALRYE